jgi:hypothetical protein
MIAIINKKVQSNTPSNSGLCLSEEEKNLEKVTTYL